jgi:hypothetical protein
MMKKFSKIKILVDGVVFTAKKNNDGSRTGVYFLMHNICERLYFHNDVELKIFFQYSDQVSTRQIEECFKGTYLMNCLDISDIKIGEEPINILMFLEAANPNLYTVSNAKVFQVVH